MHPCFPHQSPLTVQSQRRQENVTERVLHHGPKGIHPPQQLAEPVAVRGCHISGNTLSFHYSD